MEIWDTGLHTRVSPDERGDGAVLPVQACLHASQPTKSREKRSVCEPTCLLPPPLQISMDPQKAIWTCLEKLERRVHLSLWAEGLCSMLGDVELGELVQTKRWTQVPGVLLSSTIKLRTRAEGWTVVPFEGLAEKLGWTYHSNCLQIALMFCERAGRMLLKQRPLL